MAENNENEKWSGTQTRAYAGYYGLWVGLLWILSFGLTMAGLTRPLLSNLGLIAGLCSLPVGVNLVRGFRDTVGPLPLRRAWHLSWMMYLAAALLCTAAQYIYFAYIDGGRLVRVYSEMLSQPEIQDMLAKLMKGQDVEQIANEALATFGSTPPSLLAMQFLFWNVLLATLLAIPTMLMAKKKGN